MARRKRRRRRDVYSIAFVFPDGSAFCCSPERKPSEKHMKERGEYADEDFVFREYKYGPHDWTEWPKDHIRELGQTMAIRLNTRRAIRELVLPEFKAVLDSLAEIHNRLDHLETMIKDSKKEN